MTLIHPDGSGARRLTEGSARNDVLPRIKISPDGQLVAYAEHKIEGDVCKARLYVVNTDGKERREIPVSFQDDTMVMMQWSPDGSRLALGLSKRRILENSLALVNLDGSNYRTLPLPPGKWEILLDGWQVLTPGLKVPRPGALEVSP